MHEVPIYDINGIEERKITLPEIFDHPIKYELIRRAVISERSYILQPQGHYLDAGMQTTAKYYGRMNSYRSGRHMGIAIRPREKLGGGRQGKVKQIPSATKGKRAHPHMIEKKIYEHMNNKEYQSAIMSCISAAAKHHTPIIINDKIEGISKTRDMLKVFENLKLGSEIRKGREKKTRKGVRRRSRQNIYKKSVLLVVGSDSKAIKATRNIPGVSVCNIDCINANMLSPGGNSSRITIWSESALKKSMDVVKKLSVKQQSDYIKE